MDVVSASISSAPIAVRSCASVMRRAHSARSPDLFLRRWSTSSLKRSEDPLRDRGRKFLFLDAGMGVFPPCFRLIAYPAPHKFRRLSDALQRGAGWKRPQGQHARAHGLPHSLDPVQADSSSEGLFAKILAKCDAFEGPHPLPLLQF